MRALSAGLLLLLLPVGCLESYEPPLSYGRCAGSELCGLETRCDRVTASTTGAAALVCTLPCTVDGNCPGIDGGLRGAWGSRRRRDRRRPRGALPSRACSVDGDCRPGTLCRAITADAGAQRVCVADVVDVRGATRCAG